MVPVLSHAGHTPCYWILDDTGVRKYGKHSVGVARQYCGPLGKTDNCQVAVSLSLATEEGSVPLGYRLYLPREWADDPARREHAGVPEEIAFATKGELAWQQIEAALAAAIPRGPVLMDAGYGDEAALRDRLTACGLSYAAGVRSPTAVWWKAHQPVSTPTSVPVKAGRGRPRTRVQRDATHQPISVRALAHGAAGGQLSPGDVARRHQRRAAVVALRAGPCAPPMPITPARKSGCSSNGPLGETEPTHYFPSTLPAALSCKALVAAVKMRWRIERDYLELKQDVGLGHYEGRNWRGFHHHASLCIAAYGFLMLERLAAGKKTSLDSKRLPYPPASARAGLVPMQRHVPWSIATARFRLGRALARALSQCPCCGKPYGRGHRFTNTVQLGVGAGAGGWRPPHHRGKPNQIPKAPPRPQSRGGLLPRRVFPPRPRRRGGGGAQAPPPTRTTTVCHPRATAPRDAPSPLSLASTPMARGVVGHLHEEALVARHQRAVERERECHDGWSCRQPPGQSESASRQPARRNPAASRRVTGRVRVPRTPWSRATP